MTIKEIASMTNRSESWIYALSRKLGRLPTLEEVNNRKHKRGAPKKYKEKKL